MVAGNSRKQKTNVAGEKQRNMEAKRADREKGRVSGKFAKPMKPGERKLPGRKTDGREVEGRSTECRKTEGWSTESRRAESRKTDCKKEDRKTVDSKTTAWKSAARKSMYKREEGAAKKKSLCPVSRLSLIHI